MQKSSKTEEQTKTYESSSARNTHILVLGDWLVDEHWVVGKHRAASSSRTGHSHSRALHSENCSVRSLCGAGQVATVLYQAKLADTHPFQINGIGIWHRADTDILRHMLDPGFNIRRTPHRIACEDPSQPVKPMDDSTRLFSLTPPDLGVMAGTTRIIRIYRHEGEMVDLDQRLDWELPLTESDFNKIRKSIAKTLAPFKASGVSVQHILVKDLLKGVVSVELVRWLRELFPEAWWYVSSKAWRPTWFNELPKSCVRLLLVPQLAAHKAIDSGAIASSSWITGGGVPTQGALDAIDKLAEEFPSAKIVILPEGMRVLARDETNGYVLPTAGAADTFPFTPMASVFYPALAAFLISTNYRFGEALKNAIAFTATWEGIEARRTVDINWTPTPEQMLHLRDYHHQNLQPWREFSWDVVKQEWQEAFSDFGIVTVHGRRKNTQEFQLWRAMTDIRDYVTCLPSKRRLILTLLRECRSLQKQELEDRRHRSFFVVDVPGSGKSFLMSCLEKSLNMTCLKFSITSLSKRDDLIGCFQTISAAQSERPGVPLMVFFDEMNGKIERRHIYDVFLEPLEDGTYVHNGRTFRLSPCLWIFAGTEAPQVNRNASDKAQDFDSRLTQPVMFLSGSHDSQRKDSTSPQTTEQQKAESLGKLEQIYIGVSAIRQLYPDVTRISKKVLEAFSLINPEVGPRGIRRLVRSLEYVQYARVIGSNLPELWHKRMQIEDSTFKMWDKTPDSDKLLVDIRSIDSH
ncbi:MAG TPA: hypothetical protein VLB46_15500 [Pyrinomonadaceae bacterium]|nr:hypothetical protein [Pyrinomonadaceae bacterium]